MLHEASRASRDYGLSIRSAVRSLWSGAIDLDQFMDIMFSTIRRGLTRAWYEGAKACGIAPGELTPEEKAKLVGVFSGEMSFVLSFGNDILENSKANGAKLTPLLRRSRKWVNRYLDTVNLARQMACADQKLEWVIDPVKDHCKSCVRLNGKVKRGSVWEKNGVRPQNPPNSKLVCGGWRCGCELRVTDKPASRGPLPGLP